MTGERSRRRGRGGQGTDDDPSRADSGASRTAVRALRTAGRVIVETARFRLWPLLVAAGEAERTRRPRLLGIDLIVAFDVALAIVVLGATYTQLGNENLRGGSPYYQGDLLVIAVALAAPAALRDRWPRIAWLVSLLAILWASSLVRELMPPLPYQAGGVIIFLYCQYTLAARVDGRRTVLVAWAVSVASAAMLHPPGWPVSTILVSVPVLVGLNVASRRKAQHRLVEQERRHREERAVLEERQRIARELHDVVAHHMSVIAIQAEAAPYRVPDPPPELTASFADIRANALDGLSEMRRILGVLRATGDTRETVPQPDLDRLDELVDAARGAGLTVQVETTGSRLPLSAATGLSAYRILQEALSNAMRHAPRSAVRVKIRYTPTDLHLSIVNGAAAGDRDPTPGSGHGHGLAGMRERATAMGGTLTAAPTADGGYAVTAILPRHGNEAA